MLSLIRNMKQKWIAVCKLQAASASIEMKNRTKYKQGMVLKMVPNGREINFH